MTLYKRQYFSLQTQVTLENAIQQGIVTGNVLAEQGARSLAEEIQSSSNNSTPETVEDHTGIHYQSESNILDEDNAEANDSITVVKGNIVSKLQTPSKNVPSRNKPALKRDDIERLNEIKIQLILLFFSSC